MQYILVLAAAVLVYLPSLQNGYIWDDDEYVTSNMTLRSRAGLVAIWLEPTATPQYYPLVHTTFWAEYHLWGLVPVGYHADNIALHAIACVIFLSVLQRLQVSGAGWAAMLFAVHPVMVESVAWITERKNVLSAVFTLLAARSAINAWNLSDAAPKPARRRHWEYFCCIILFIAAMLAKTVACTLPLSLLLLIWWRRGRIRLMEIWQVIPMLGIGGGFAMLTAWLERHHVGAEGSGWHLSIFQRIMLAGTAPWFYAGKLLFPWPLIFIYPRWTLQSDQPLNWLLPVLLILTLSALYLSRARIGRGPLTLTAVFITTLTPALGFVNVYPFLFSFVADHFQYLAAPAIFTAIGSSWSRVGGSIQTFAGVAMLILLAGLTWHQQSIYENVRTLWTNTARANPSAWIAFNNLAVMDFKAGRYEQSISEMQKTAALDPDNPKLDANLGIALLQLHRAAEAETALSRAVLQEPGNADAWRGLGNAHSQCGHDIAARDALERARQLKPDSLQPIADLAWLKATSPEKAVRDPSTALELATTGERMSNGYSILCVEAKAAAEAALGRFDQAANDASRAASMSDASGDILRGREDRRWAIDYAVGKGH